MITVIMYNYHTKRKNTFRDVTEYTDKFGEIRIVHGNAVTLLGNTMYRLVEILIEK
jgi:hypothetical protein